jgi:hypothetical protein
VQNSPVSRRFISLAAWKVLKSGTLHNGPTRSRPVTSSNENKLFNDITIIIIIIIIIIIVINVFLLSSPAASYFHLQALQLWAIHPTYSFATVSKRRYSNCSKLDEV